MKFSKQACLIILVAFFSMNCSTEKEGIQGFDQHSWMQDHNGCQGKRIGQLALVKASKNELKGFSAESIDRLFGKPDTRDLDKRHKLYYTYNIAGASECAMDSSQRIYLQIRFNAMNKADELIIFQ